MSPYRVELTSGAARQVEKLPRGVQPRILSALESLSADPRPPGCKKLAGHPSGWPTRVGEYRIVYAIDDPSRVVTVGRVAHRRDVYRS